MPSSTNTPPASNPTLSLQARSTEQTKKSAGGALLKYLQSKYPDYTKVRDLTVVNIREGYGDVLTFFTSLGYFFIYYHEKSTGTPYASGTILQWCSAIKETLLLQLGEDKDLWGPLQPDQNGVKMPLWYGECRDSVERTYNQHWKLDECGGALEADDPDNVLYLEDLIEFSLGGSANVHEERRRAPTAAPELSLHREGWRAEVPAVDRPDGSSLGWQTWVPRFVMARGEEHQFLLAYRHS